MPLLLRPALLAGIAIVERLGPKIIAELHGRTLGAYHAHFGTVAARILRVTPPYFLSLHSCSIFEILAATNCMFSCSDDRCNPPQSHV